MGLATLNELASDQRLTANGREEAARIRQWVVEGKHVPYLRAIVEDDEYSWRLRGLFEHIYSVDEKLEASNSAQP